MPNDKNFYALLQFIDDTDEVVFQSVAQHIKACGPNILPHLHFLQDTDPREIVQIRTISLISSIRFHFTAQQLVNWVNNPYPSLWRGLVLVNEYLLPSTDSISLLNAFNTIKRSVWLELNDYLTPLEQINIVNKSLYQHEGFQIGETNYQCSKEFLLDNLLNKKKCNNLLMGIFYHLICSSLEIPVVLLQIQSKLVLAYAFQDQYFDNIYNHRYIFFVDPSSGQSFSPEAIDQLLNVQVSRNDILHAKALTNKEIIQLLITNMADCYDDKNQYKVGLLQFSNLISH